MSRKRILIASLTDHTIDGRILRQIRLLSQSYDVIAAGSTATSFPGVESITLRKPRFDKSLWHRMTSLALLLTRRYERYYWTRPWVISAYEELKQAEFDLILVNDLPLLPVGIRIARGRPVVFDAHEYYPRQHDEQLFFRLLLRPYLNALCRKALCRTSAMLTVSPGLARGYLRQFGVVPTVVRNTPNLQSLTPTRVDERVRLVYHGVAQRRRSIGLLVDAARRLDKRFELHLVLKTNQATVRELKERAKGSENVVFHAPVPNEELCRWINQFDLGLSFFPPVTFNLEHCLPNKFFECIQARLGVVVGPSPDLAAIVQEERCGVVTRDFSVESLVETLQQLTVQDVERLKRRSHEIADRYCWKVDSEVLAEVVRRALADSTRGPNASRCENASRISNSV